MEVSSFALSKVFQTMLVLRRTTVQYLILTRSAGDLLTDPQVMAHQPLPPDFDGINVTDDHMLVSENSKNLKVSMEAYLY